ncbi:hypothetical protein BF29_1806 [Heyndrickxia coagulans DSM 1 = ATCC 7050]|uniref:Uncharacterized protein n=1 Tax=Heyndrickxia coagulans DSM 1 = ATCC 7050 TaxID=1121088 RepID=A0A8B4BYL4_HEYCO|nr:hypothetical protein BF29_1806 [Heyndrickxia coagulans DSM 1 = ATCC 7050]SHF98102.1 hypothetical protein SAMN02745208_03015 [Heyndrickxia coagulans DSM 1 = ATCC 7050]
MNTWDILMHGNLYEQEFEADTEEEFKFIKELQGEYEYER